MYRGCKKYGLADFIVKILTIGSVDSNQYLSDSGGVHVKTWWINDHKI
jgi:hypothetical protein